MKKKSKSGQMHMTETIAVLFVFFILIVFGMIFYFQYQKGAILEEQEANFEKRMMETTLKVLFLPELVCSSPLQEEQEDNCFDLIKLEHAKELFQPEGEEDLERRRYYNDLFSYARIEVRQLSPVAEEPIVLYDHSKPESNSEPTYFVVVIKDELKDQYHFGYLNVTVYS